MSQQENYLLQYRGEALSLQLYSINIQQEIELTKKGVDRLQEHWPDIVALKADSQASIYDYYPYLFLKAFPLLSIADVRPFALAGRLFASSIVFYDKVMDRTSTAHIATTSALRIQAMQLEAYHLLHQLFPPEAIFWKQLRSYIVEYADACIQEQRFASGDLPWQEYTEAIALQIAVGKNGIARSTIAGLVELAQDHSLFKPLVEVINHFNIACQMWDDLLDWKEDLRCSIPSLLLSRVVSEWPVHCEQENLNHQLNHLARKFYYDGHGRC